LEKELLAINHQKSGPYSPDLNPCDYFLWGFLKDRVYSENIGNVSLLKERIKQYCAEISEEICKNVVKDLLFRLNYSMII
jgi:hypothetical protein